MTLKQCIVVMTTKRYDTPSVYLCIVVMTTKLYDTPSVYLCIVVMTTKQYDTPVCTGRPCQQHPLLGQGHQLSGWGILHGSWSGRRRRQTERVPRSRSHFSSSFPCFLLVALNGLLEIVNFRHCVEFYQYFLFTYF